MRGPRLSQETQSAEKGEQVLASSLDALLYDLEPHFPALGLNRVEKDSFYQSRDEICFVDPQSEENRFYLDDNILIVLEPEYGFITRYTINSYFINPCGQMTLLHTSDFKGDSYATSRDKSINLFSSLKRFIHNRYENPPEGVLRKEWHEQGYHVRGEGINREIYLWDRYDHLPPDDLKVFFPLYEELLKKVNMDGLTEFGKHARQILIAKNLEQHMNDYCSLVESMH